MATLRNRPLFSTRYEDAAMFLPEPGAVYLYGTLEERSEHSQSWRSSAKDVYFVKLEEASRTMVNIDGHGSVSVRDMGALTNFLLGLGRENIYIDFTGLGHNIWAPLVRAALVARRKLTAVYVEPDKYSYSDTPRQGDIFDLSDRIEGIAPIPGFSSLAQPRAGSVCFVPLLGFEGVRLKHLIENVDPPGGKIIPIVGVPGYRTEYPFHTYLGNSSSLAETRGWRNVRFARANCPFSLFYVLEEILREYPEDHVKVAPIGTKPHALGAILHSILGSRPVEIVYDHPLRRKKRTTGKAACMVYRVEEFLEAVR